MVSQRGRNWFRSSWFRVSVAFLIAMVTVVSVTGAYRILSLPRDEPRVSILSYPIELTIELEKIAFASGEKVSILFTLKNVSNESVKITMPAMQGDPESPLPGMYADPESPFLDRCHFMVFALRVSDQSGTQIFSRGEHAGGYPTIWCFILGPFEAVSQVVVWDQTMTVWNTDRGVPDQVSVSRGTYNIRGIIPPLGFFDINDGSLITVETPTISILIG